MFDAPAEQTPRPFQRTNIVSYMLGGFVVFQLLFIPLGNYIKLVPVRIPEHHGEIDSELQRNAPPDMKCREPMQTIFDYTATICSRWAEVSGQKQCWALFTGFGERASVPVVELRWDDGQHEPVRLMSHFEPADPSNYFYWPEPCCRMWNYDNRMTLIHFAITPKTVPDPAVYRRECINCVRNMRKSMSAYLRWKTDRYLATHPNLPQPQTVTLIARIWPTPPPGTSNRDRSKAEEIPLARWTPARIVANDESPLEAWDPVGAEFVRLKLGGAQ